MSGTTELAGKRLPGIYFINQTEGPRRDLPPMDVTAFVGFAERGPLDIPVPVEGPDTFRQIFGGPLALARLDGERLVYAHLANAIEAFFANGGRRCYVVRVANRADRSGSRSVSLGRPASASAFQLKGLVAVDQNVAGPGAQPVKRQRIQAASPGEWSAAIGLATRLQRTPLPPDAFEFLDDGRICWRSTGAADVLRAGDLLHLDFGEGTACHLFPINSLAQADVGGSTATILTSVDQTWRTTTTLADLPSVPALGSPPAEVEIVAVERLTDSGSEALPHSGRLREAGSRGLQLALDGDGASSPPVSPLGEGDILLLATEPPTGLSPLYFAVSRRTMGEENDSRPASLLLDGDELLFQDDSQASPPGAARPEESPARPLQRIERLRLDLVLRDGEQMLPPLLSMGFGPAHPRFWGNALLLASSPLYRRNVSQNDDRGLARAATIYHALQQPTRLSREATADVKHEVEEEMLAIHAARLAPLAAEASSQFFLPLGMAGITVESDFEGPVDGQVGRNGLEKLDALLFLDDYLTPDPATQQTGRTSLLDRSIDRYYIQNRRLLGLHGLLPIDEISLLALPDAMHLGWEPAPPAEAAPEPTEPPNEAPSPVGFVDCVTPSADVEGRSSPDDSAADDADRPASMPLPLAIRPEDLSPTIPFEQRYATLFELQQALINLCCARRDAVAVLALPRHFEKRDCLQWMATLRRRLGLPTRGAEHNDIADLTDLSYAAIFHPWLVYIDGEGRQWSSPPDASACGLIAQREATRGAWIAPANLAVQRVLDLEPRIDEEDWALLFTEGFNLIRSLPLDFRLMGAHTLSDERNWRQLSVRRLLILLRKVALERGMDFVFENNSERLRSSVQIALEALLQEMFERGAFAGDTPAQSYRVSVDEGLNPRQAVDNGRFLAQIQVAPSQPMEFITVLLTRLGQGSLTATEAI